MAQYPPDSIPASSSSLPRLLAEEHHLALCGQSAKWPAKTCEFARSKRERVQDEREISELQRTFAFFESLQAVSHNSNVILPLGSVYGDIRTSRAPKPSPVI